MHLSNIQRYILESIFVYFIIPYCGIAFAFSLIFLALMIMFSLVLMPLYSILSPLRFDSVLKWFIPLVNAVLIYIPIKYFICNDYYFYRNIPYIIGAGYIAILIKIFVKKLRAKS